MVDAGTFFEIKARWAQEIVVGLRPARRPGRRHRRQPAEACAAARSSSTPPTRPRGSSRCATPSTSRWCSSQDVPGFMVGVGGGAAGHHPPRRQDDRRDVVARTCRSSRSSCARPTRRATTPCARPGSSRAPRSPCPRATIGPMSAEASVNAVYANKIAAIGDAEERAAYVAERTDRAAGRHRPAAHGQRPRRRRRRRARRPARASSSRGWPTPTAGPARPAAATT